MVHVVALLRAVNVGRGRRVPMADLRALLEELGVGPARTYLQSGNVVLTTARQDLEALAAELSSAVDERFGFAVPVLLRRPADLEAVVAACPFPDPGNEPKAHHVAFLSAAPAPERVASIAALDAGADRVAVLGKEAFVRYAAGAGRSTLTIDRLERVLGVTSTARNWSTVLALRDLVGGG